MINYSIITIISFCPFYLYLYFSFLFNSPVTNALLTTSLFKNVIFHGQPWMVQTKKNTEKDKKEDQQQ